VSADESASALSATIRDLTAGLEPRLSLPRGALAGAAARVTVDDRFVGDGYGLPTAASREALVVAARSEGLFLDTTYTAKALAGLIARQRAGEFAQAATVVFWHTGGQVGLFS
jgi:1-aminocyclopropane-1-carboxylate deaminase/D-cysteine desulfhydrase-like pyridoxal-dependent ACC family enzyme